MTEIQFVRGAIDASDCIANAFELVKRRFWLYIGVGLVTILAISCIPFVNFVLLGPMMGGFSYLVLKDMRNEPVDFGMLFKGFEKFVPLMVIGLIQAIPGIILQVIQYTVDLASLPGGLGLPSSGSPTELGGVSFFPGGIMIFYFGYFIFQMIWSLALTFAIPLIIEHGTDLGETIRLSFSAVFANLGGLILMAILGFVVGLLGVLAVCIGVFVAIPIVFAANVFAYRMVFPIQAGDLNYSPPPPDAYDGSFGRGR